MSSISPILTRATMLMHGDHLTGTLRHTQHELFKAQRQISTGVSVARPSDAPGQTGVIQFLRQQLAQRTQQQSSLQNAETMLNHVDSALREGNDILLDARNAALGQIGVGSDSDTRRNTALTLDANIDALIDIGNRQFNQVSLFGGDGKGDRDEPMFEWFLGGVRYRGGEQSLHASAGFGDQTPLNASGADVFGALAARVSSAVDLDPQPSNDTRLAHLAGTRGEGVSLGAVHVTVNGTTHRVDLSNAEHMGDVVTRINAAVEASAPGAGALAIDGPGYALTANAGHTITIADVGSARVATDLGIDISAADAQTTAGGDVQRRLDPSTRLESLGAAIDFDSGLHITQGGHTKIADFSQAETIQDMQNIVHQLDLGLRLQINSERNGLHLVSEVSGIELSVGENGGTTASDLGLRSLDTHTALSDFRHGRGVETHKDGPDVVFTLRNGTSFEVDLHGATHVADVIAAIEGAAADAGLSVGENGDFHVGFADIGNGFVFTDHTSGDETFRIANAGQSHAATHLGIAGVAQGGDTLTSADHATVKVDGAFTHLIDLRNALRNDDERGITLAGSGLEHDLDRFTRAQAQTGIDTQRVQQLRSRSQDQQIAEESMLSTIRDASLPEVITRFTQLQTQLQASLQVGAQNMRLSLLDFLR